jgi:hypothetical protein
MFESSVSAGSALSGPIDQAAWLAGLCARGADRARLVEALVAVQSQLAWLASVEASVLAAFHTLDDVDLGEVPEALRATMREQGKDWISEEVGLAIRIPARFARERMLVAHQLVTRLPEMLDQLRIGAVTPVQARSIAEAVIALPDPACRRVQERVIGRAPEQSNAQFNRSLKRALLAVSSASTDDLVAAAVAQRQVQITPLENGMAELWAVLPAPEAMRLKTAIWRLGQHRRRVPLLDPSGSCGVGSSTSTEPVGFVAADQRRADALIELADRYLADSDPTG